MTALFVPAPSATPTPAHVLEEMLAAPSFGTTFTDHMARATWTLENGWTGHRICPLENYSLHPASAILHYAQEVFEGIKAFRHADESIVMFRPDMNARRMIASAERLALPSLGEDEFLDSLQGLLEIDSDWVPRADGGGSLYLRPYLFASEPFLGVRTSACVEYGVIASPAGPYFSAGSVGISLWITTIYTRASEGGTGAAKCGGNYAGSMAAQREAATKGCDQVLYTKETTRGRLIEESGAMNIFAVTRDGRLVTPSLGTILAGVTRDSLLQLAPLHGLRPEECELYLHDFLEACRDGSITEVFAAGTAAVVTPITRFLGEDLDVTVGDGRPGPRSASLREHLVGIQTGGEQDIFGWLRKV